MTPLERRPLIEDQPVIPIIARFPQLATCSPWARPWVLLANMYRLGTGDATLANLARRTAALMVQRLSLFVLLARIRERCYAQFMAIFLCRWPNGDFSIVSARTKGDAIELLDEWGNAEQALLTRMSECMFDFRLGDDGEIELANVGESTQESIMETCYPELGKAVATAEWDDSGVGYSAQALDQIRQAVELERIRLWVDQPPAKEAETALGREIQKQTGAASVLVNRIVRDAARKRLKSHEGEGTKPN